MGTKSNPVNDAITALDNAIEALTSFRDGFAEAIGASAGGSGDGDTGSRVRGKATSRADTSDDLDESAGKDAGKKGAGGKAGSKGGKKAPPPIEFEDLKEKFLEYIKENGAESGKTLLATLGVKKLSDLSEDQYADAMAGIEAGGDNDDDLL